MKWNKEDEDYKEEMKMHMEVAGEMCVCERDGARVSERISGREGLK